MASLEAFFPSRFLRFGWSDFRFRVLLEGRV